ncbi:MAG: 50S ribosomal protein L17 [Deltaproteobacteria bacterium]|nr:50S ribosomal protein L17 [Deltaproteobacteria bacterium]
MRHRNSGRRFDMDSTQRKAMFRNLVTSLVLHGSIRTTEERAKELRKVADRLVTIGKSAPSIEGLEGEALAKAKALRVNAIRRARQVLMDGEAVNVLFREVAPRLQTRAGGYTRVIKAGLRPGDSARMAVIQLVEAVEG